MNVDETDVWLVQRVDVARSLDARVTFVSPGTKTDIVWSIDLMQPDGARGLARLFRFEFDEGDNAMMWGARVRYWLDLAPATDSRAASMQRLVAKARAAVLKQSGDHPDRTLQIRWPSRDPEGSAALEAGGFRPMLHMACLPDIQSHVRSVVASAWQIERAASTDTEAIAALVLELQRLETRSGAFRLPPVAAEYVTSSVADAIQAGRTLVCRDESGEVIGCLEVALNPDDPWMSGSLAFSDLALFSGVFVRPDVRGAGVASALLETAVTGTPSGTTGVVVHTAKNETAANFWRHRGFDPVWTTWLQPV